MLVVSVVVLTIILTGYAFVPKFRTGVNRVGADVERMLSTGQRMRRVAPAPAPAPFTLPGNFRLPRGPRNAGCASSTACGNPEPRGPLGAPLNVCRPGDNC